jgi:hypothetical protein
MQVRTHTDWRLEMEDAQLRQIVAAILAAGGDEPADAVERYREILGALMVNVVTVKADSGMEETAAALRAADKPFTVIIREFDD